MAQGRSLELYLVDGNPEGMLTAEIFNWTGHVLRFARTQIVAALSCPAAHQTGVYLLLGDDEAGPRAYIGESEDIAERMKTHDVKKDFWTLAVLITTQANNLHKAHVKYLEARLVEEARRIGRMPLDNITTPARPGLSEAAQANMEEFLATLFIVLPAIGVDMFVARARPERGATPAPAPQGAPVFHIAAPRVGISARAQLIGGEFVVAKGALARGQWAGVDYVTYRALYDELRETGVLVAEGDQCRFAENYAFSSPSAAAAVVLGRAANGTLEWKTPDGRSYKEWEAERLAAATKGDADD